MSKILKKGSGNDVWPEEMFFARFFAAPTEATRVSRAGLLELAKSSGSLLHGQTRRVTTSDP